MLDSNNSSAGLLTLSIKVARQLINGFVLLTTVSLPLANAGQQETDQTALAQQYVSLRAGVLLKAQDYTASKKPDLKDRRVISSLTTNILRSYRRDSNWNPQNPEWKHAATIIERDMEQIVSELAANTRLNQVAKDMEEAFVRSLSAKLNSERLNELVNYYSQPTGAQFAKVQEKLHNALISGISDLQAKLIAGQRESRSQNTINPDAYKELVGLFDELVRIQWGILDPGPGQDRSGLQAIPIMVAAVVKDNYETLNKIWHEISEEDRKTIIVRRNSSLGKSEREAIFEAAKEIRKVVNPQAEMAALVKTFAPYDAKWRALVKASQK